MLAARGGTPDPALAFSLRWLRDHIPSYDGPPVLVQGDTGPGNFMYLDGRVTAVVDWELAHLGDPMDDIAWLSLRATQEPFTDFPTRLREYEALSGNVVDEVRVRYYQVMAETKLQVMGHRGPSDGDGDDGRGGAEGGGSDVGNGFIYQVLHRRLWLEALATANGLELQRRRDAAGAAVPGQRLDVRRRPRPVARRDRSPHDGSVGGGSWKGDRPHHQVPGASRHATAPTTRSASWGTWRHCSVGGPIR